MRAFVLSFIALSLSAACGAPESSPPIAVPRGPVAPVVAATASPIAPVVPSSAARATRKTPRIVQLSPSDASCGLDAEGRVWELVVGKMEPEVPSLVGAKSIACGMLHTCVVTAEGTMSCWGNNAYGGLGDGTEKNRFEPGPVVGLGQVAEIGVDYARTCARTPTGDVYCWGDSEFGKAGDGRLPDNVGREKTKPGKAILAGAATLSVGSAHACSAMPDGRVSCWGQNTSGACGQPVATRYVPRPVFVPKLSNVAMVRAGAQATCTIDRQGKVACFGHAGTGLLGPNGPSGDVASSSTPVTIPLPWPAVEIAIGGSTHACARLARGEVACWGQNDHGQLGDGTTKESRAPLLVRGLPGPATALSLGLEKSCALVDGRVLCWGKGVVRRDENSFPDDSSEPIEVLVEGAFRKGR